MTLLQMVPSYQIPRDADGRPSRQFNRLFELAMRWWPDIEIPAEMISAASKRKGENPQHAGGTALHQLQGGSAISERQLQAALTYIRDAIDYYESAPSEPYPGRNDEAVANFRELLAEMV